MSTEKRAGKYKTTFGISRQLCGLLLSDTSKDSAMPSTTETTDTAADIHHQREFILAAMLDMVRRGFAVLPLLPNRKIPFEWRKDNTNRRNCSEKDRRLAG